MYKKGSITVYLSLMLTILISLFAASMYSVQLAGARVQAVHAADQGMYSLFARYDISMLKRYHLFFIDGSLNSGELKMGKVYQILENDIAAIVGDRNRTSGKKGMIDGLMMKNGSITGYTLATDNGGNALKSQAVSYMETVLGVQGVRSLMEKVQIETETVQHIEDEYEALDEESVMACYESVKSSGVQPSELEVTYENGEAVTIPEDYVNPVETVKHIKGKGILSLVLPGESRISSAYQTRSAVISGRSLAQGMGTPAFDSSCDSWQSELMFTEYILEHLGCYTEVLPANGLQYQLEYVIQGKESDIENLKGVINKLLLIREASNLIYLYQDETKRAQVKAAALLLASLFGVPESAEVLEPVLLMCWAFGESLLDMRGLLAGDRIPLQKNDASWQLSLSDLPKIVYNADSLRKSSKTGMNYQEYLRILLLMKESQDKLRRSMDMIEMGMRAEEGKKCFRLDCCIYTLEARLNFEAGGGVLYHAVRSYGYDMG